MKLTKEVFGSFQGENVNLFSLTNENGLTVKIMNYGATITDIVIPEGKSIACGFNKFEQSFSDE